MPVTTIRPVTFSDGSTNTGSGNTSIGGTPSPLTKVQAVIDSLDTTDLRATITTPASGGISAQGFETFNLGDIAALAAGAQLRSIIPRVRTRLGAAATGIGHTLTFTEPGGGSYPEDALTSSTTLTTLAGSTKTATAGGVTLSVDYVNSLSLQVGWGYFVGHTPGASVSLQAVELLVDVNISNAPVATAGATFTAATSRPTFSWTYAGDGAAQESFRVKVFDAATYGAVGFNPAIATPAADSGTVNGAALSWVTTVDLVNATTYRAFIWVTDVGSGGRTNIVSAAGPYQQTTVTITPPNAPTLTVAVADNLARRVTLSIASTNNLTATATKYRWEIQRSTDAGATWTTLTRLQNSVLTNPAYGDVDYSTVASPSATLYDYEAPFASVLYRARVSATSGGNALASTWTADQTAVVSTPTRWVLKSLFNANLNIYPIVGDDALTMNSEERQSINYALGRRNPIVLGDVIGGESLELNLTVLDQTAWTALETLRATQAVLLLESPYGDRLYVRIVGSRSASWTLNGAFSRKRRVKVSLVEQDSPG